MVVTRFWPLLRELTVALIDVKYQSEIGTLFTMIEAMNPTKWIWRGTTVEINKKTVVFHISPPSL